MRLYTVAWWLRIHLSPQIFVEYLVSILQKIHSLRRGIKSTKLLHKEEGLVPSLASKKLLLEKYLHFNVLGTKDFGFNNILHTCLASNALLKFQISLDLNPPLVFEVRNFSHLFQWILLSFLPYPHQNLERHATISLHSFLGN